MIAEFLITIIVILCLKFIRDRKKEHGVFQRLGIPGPAPNLFFGNMLELIPGPSIAIARWEKAYGRTFGYFEGGLPVLVTADADIIKQVYIKDFSKFTARKPFPFGPDPDEGQTISVVLARGHRWKRLRSIMSPTFSTNKLKQTTPLVMKGVDTLMEVLEEKRIEDQSFNIMALFQGLTLDVIASTAFGLDIDAQRNTDSKFIASCRQVFAEQNFSNLPLIRKGIFLTAVCFPIFGKWMFEVFRFLNEKNILGFGGFWIADQAKGVIQQRKTKGVESGNDKRIDFLQLMLDAETVDEMIDDSALTMTQDDDAVDVVKNGTTSTKSLSGVKVAKKISALEMVSNAVVFVLAGYETTSTALSYAAHELATHPESQAKLQQELDKELDDNLPDYQTLSKLQYLDMVFNEVLRKNPVAPNFVTRLSMEECNIGDKVIPAGVCVQINVNSIHNDQDIWGPTDPALFDPERFSSENKANRHPGAFQAFGTGPRNCVGMRFALLEGKLALARILQKYNIEKCSMTEERVITTEQATVVPKNGVMVKLSLRQDRPS